MIVIHIGLRKAGSSSLQAFLAENDEALREIGLDYPRIGRRGRVFTASHKNLQCEVRGRRRLFDPKQGTLAEVADYWRASPANTLVLSSEGFEECTTAQANRLKTLAREPHEPIRIVLIIRDLIRVVPSSYAQKIKAGNYTSGFDRFFGERMDQRRVDYFDTAANWAEAFGWENLRIRQLEPAFLLNGDPIDDFLANAGYDPSSTAIEVMKRPGVINVAPGWRVLEAIRALFRGAYRLPAAHPLTAAPRFDRRLREDIGLCAVQVGQAIGWNVERGQYLTSAQARRCRKLYRRAVRRIREYVDGPPPPERLADFPERPFSPDAGLIDSRELISFYDAVAMLANERSLLTSRNTTAFAT